MKGWSWSFNGGPVGPLRTLGGRVLLCAADFQRKKTEVARPNALKTNHNSAGGPQLQKAADLADSRRKYPSRADPGFQVVPCM